MRFTRFEDDLRKRLRDREFAVHYLEAALEESVEEFLYAIREVASAQEGGLRGVAERAGVGRESMYKSLSKTGNPQFRAVESILGAMGLALCVTTADASAERGDEVCAAG